MQTVMAILATALMLTFLEFGLSTPDAQAEYGQRRGQQQHGREASGRIT